MSRPAGLLAYLSVAALGLPALRRRVAAEIARGGARSAREAERIGQPSHRRPDGPVVWLHAATPTQVGALCDLARRLGEAFPEATALLTSEVLPGPEAELPPRTLHQLVPHDASGPVDGFLDHWRPQLCLWAGTELRPALIHEAARRDVPLYLVDAGTAPGPGRGWQRFTGLTAATLRRFSRIFAIDERAAEAIRAAGAPEAVVEIAGPLEEETTALPCNMRERDALGAVLKARPVWLAAAVAPTEEAAVIEAYRAAARLAHRLLLILVPAESQRGPALAHELAERGMAVALRSVEGDPGPETEVFVADGEGELGLWYRLAPVTFMGGTLDAAAGGGRSPLEPASLGSAILHGPATGPNAAIYGRFRAVNAAREIADAAALGEALSDLLSPDRAATMAHEAWRVSTGGADTNERVLALVSERLTPRDAA